jgi:hypothetical protein
MSDTGARTVTRIRTLYLRTGPQTIQRDLTRAVELLRTLPTETARERAAVYMDGLSQLRSEWTLARKRRAKHR